MAKEALVVKRDVLFKDKYFYGFLPAEQHDFISVILANKDYHERGEALENNAMLQQVIPYVWIVNKNEMKVFAYKRSGGTNYNEARLRNKWSCGLGGHIERIDAADPIEGAMMRELQEEVKIAEYGKPKIIGYVKDDADSVGLVHFGVVALLDTDLEIKAGDDEMQHGRLFTIGDFENEMAKPENELEGWSKLSWPYVKNYLLSKN